MKSKKTPTKANASPIKIPPPVKEGPAPPALATPKFEIVGSADPSKDYSPCERDFYLSARETAISAGCLEKRYFATTELLRRNLPELADSANKILVSAGFPKTRASELVQIARSCPTKTFEAWRRGEIGFRGVLTAARAQKNSKSLPGSTNALNSGRRALVRSFKELTDEEKSLVRPIVEVYKELAPSRPLDTGHMRTPHTVNKAIHRIMNARKPPLSFKVAAQQLLKDSTVAANSEETKIQNKEKTRWEVPCAKIFFGQWPL